MGRGTRAGAAGGGGSSTRRAAAEGEDGGAAVEGEAGGGGGGAAAVAGSGAAAGSSRPGGGGWKMRPWSRAAPTSRREGKAGPGDSTDACAGEEVLLRRVWGAGRRSASSRAVESSDATGEQKEGEGRTGQRADCLSRSGVPFPQGCALADA